MEHNFKRLDIWQKSMDLVCEVYTLSKSYPKEEKFGLVSQMRRCAITIPSKIAEGSYVQADKNFSHYLEIVTGSLYRLHSQLIISKNLDYISTQQLENLSSEIKTLNKLLSTYKMLANN